MRYVLGTVVFILIAGSSLAEAKENSKEVLLNAETIRTLSQDLPKNYFYIQQKIQASSAKKGLKKDIILLGESIRKLQGSVKDPEAQKVVEFMFFSVEEIKSILKEPFNEENGGLMLDYTETLLEGSESLIKKNKPKKETMLEVVEEMSFLLERASKYYIAFRAGYKDVVNVEQAQKSVERFELLLQKVKNHNYPAKIANGPVKKLMKYWPVSKSFYLGIKRNELPTIVFISTKHMKKAIDELIKFHSK